jgi:transposase InsO family protein
MSMEEQIVALRSDHPRWGPRKLRARLSSISPATAWPAASTIGGLLKRRGLVVPRRRRSAMPPSMLPFAACGAPNDVWCMDFKGWFRTGDGRRCEPLTISDADTRYLLRCQVLPRLDTRSVQPLLEATFREFGLPAAIRTDNGAPFASRSAGGLSRLSVWWIKLGIRPERIAPGRPCQNGRHERMHGTMAREACDPPAASLARQQLRLDAFRRIYNEERPHEALGNVTPASLYRPSPRPLPTRLSPIVYPDHWQARTVRPSGEIKWQGEYVFISELLDGAPVGIEETAGGFRVHFGPVPLGTMDRAGRFHCYRRARGRGALRSPVASRAAHTTVEE